MPDTPGKRKFEETHEAQAVHRKKNTKHHKTFLDSRQDALSLAALIVDAEEQKSSKKTERIKATKHHPTSRPSSTARSRLEERKEALAAQVNRAKRNRTKSRKSRLNDSSQDNSVCQDNKGQVRKSVTFA